MVDLKEQDEFDKMFFETHGVGNEPVDQEYELIAHTLDPSQPTFKEVEFCRLVAKGEPQYQAYKQVFGTENNKYAENASAMLMKRPRVMKKLFEIRQRLAELQEESLENMIHELNEARNVAKMMGQPAAMVSAIKVKANLMGLEKTNQAPTINIQLSDEQKKALLGRITHKVIQKEEHVEDVEYVDVRRDRELE